MGRNFSKLAVALLGLGVTEPAAAQKVFSYLPYWERTTYLESVPWELMDTVAYFDAELGVDGIVYDWHGWLDDPEVEQLIDAANDHGKRVVLTVSMFGSSSIAAFLGDAQAQQTFIGEILPAVLGEGAHGVNIDFEFPGSSRRNAFTAFIQQLADAFHDVSPSSHVSIAGPAVDWWGSFDVPVLLQSLDAIFIMGYNYHYSGGDPGPVAPLSGGGGSPWSGGINLQATVDEYLSLGVGYESKLILGLPLYGYVWPSDSGAPGAIALGLGSAIFYDTWQSWVPDAEIQWDEVSATPWYTVADGAGWDQYWCEDAVSVAAKMDLALDSGLGGFGFWALGYDGADPDLWQEVAVRLPVVGADDPSGSKEPVAPRPRGEGEGSMTMDPGPDDPTIGGGQTEFEDPFGPVPDSGCGCSLGYAPR